MPVAGDLTSMSLPDVMQWLGQARKTGTLALERARARKRIFFREGRIVGCTTDNAPADMLGQFLLARGRITEDILRRALDRQRESGRLLGEVLVEMGAASYEEMTRLLRQKAEEAIFGLFDWQDGSFVFSEKEPPPEGLFPVDLRVEDVLLRGAERCDEMRRIRSALPDPGIVLRHTETPPPPQILRNRMAWRIYMSIDGHRTVAEILLHAHGSEFIVTKFLFELLRNGLAEIAEAPPRPPAAPASTLPNEPAAELEPAPADLDSLRRLLEAGRLEEALDGLEAAHRSSPADEAIRRLLADAEVAFIEKAYKHFVPPSRIPVPVRPPESLTGERLSPQEFFLLSRMDGSWDVRSILQIAPIREVEALRALKRLRERGLIELREADPAAASAERQGRAANFG